MQNAEYSLRGIFTVFSVIMQSQHDSPTKYVSFLAWESLSPPVSRGVNNHRVQTDCIAGWPADSAPRRRLACACRGGSAGYYITHLDTQWSPKHFLRIYGKKIGTFFLG